MRGSDRFDDPFLMGMAGSLKISGPTADQYATEPDGEEGPGIGRGLSPMLPGQSHHSRNTDNVLISGPGEKSCIPYLG